MPPALHIPLDQIDTTKIVADQEAIRKLNQQRFEMEHLTAVVYMDPTQHLMIGYKDVRDDEFWVRGHMPGYPIMPGVIMCEAAAQLCGFYIATHKIMIGDFIGFGGLENVRFRAPVKPGDRLLLVGKGTRIHRRQTVCNVQGFVGTTMVFHADVLGVPLLRREEG
ncbi:MAG: beta-hydroxyacyl-ACP dehydratase [Gemmataceae bacterium]|nr:beta-hydroxyacyl-ACP dehydratase [Gemmataceae bacterium]